MQHHLSTLPMEIRIARECLLLAMHPMDILLPGMVLHVLTSSWTACSGSQLYGYCSRVGATVDKMVVGKAYAHSLAHIVSILTIQYNHIARVFEGEKPIIWLLQQGQCYYRQNGGGQSIRS